MSPVLFLQQRKCHSYIQHVKEKLEYEKFKELEKVGAIQFETKIEVEIENPQPHLLCMKTSTVSYSFFLQL